MAHLIIAAFWSERIVTDEVAAALGRDNFPDRDGRPGAVVSFPEETVVLPGFRRIMERLDLAEINDAA